MITEDDIRAIRAVVKDEMDKMRMKVSEFSGRGSHTVISSLGDIVLQPGNGCRAIYKNAEIGSGGGIVYLNASHTMWITADGNTLVLHVPAGGDWRIEEGT